MTQIVSAIAVPGGSEISKHLPGAFFYDCFALPVNANAPSAIEIYLDLASKTPGWVSRLMAIRNFTVSLIGLKNLGHLQPDRAARQARVYRVGDRIGIFSLLYLTDKEIILGDSDKHLDVKVSVSKLTIDERCTVAITTIVHLNNMLGRIYMFFVGPIHKMIVPAMLIKASSRLAD